MPIKFRCQHCDQFLGIARSRAGAHVDCPRCGNVLRVPGNSTAASHQRGSSTSEDSLVSALSELSALANNTASDDPLPSSTDHTPVALADQAIPFTTYHAVAPVERATPSVPSVEQPAPLTIGDVAGEDANERMTEKDGLAELAALSADYSPGEISPALLDEMRSVSRGTGQTVATLIGGACLLLLGLAGGWYLARSGNDQHLPLLNFTSARERSDESTDTVTIPGDFPGTTAERVVTGTVQYENESRKRLPDAGAFVLILPVKHPGTLLLNSKSLIRGDDHADFKATAAALASLGGRIVRVADDGGFATSIAPESNFVVIAVSQHVSRPDAVPVAAGISNVLQTWFDSPSRLVGLRAATASPLGSDTNQLEFDFQL